MNRGRKLRGRTAGGGRGRSRSLNDRRRLVRPRLLLLLLRRRGRASGDSWRSGGGPPAERRVKVAQRLFLEEKVQKTKPPAQQSCFVFSEASTQLSVVWGCDAQTQRAAVRDNVCSAR